MDHETFANSMIALGREHGFVLGLKRAIEILRAHGVDVSHPARMQIFDEMQNCDRHSVAAYKNGAISARIEA